MSEIEKGLFAMIYTLRIEKGSSVPDATKSAERAVQALQRSVEKLLMKDDVTDEELLNMSDIEYDKRVKAMSPHQLTAEVDRLSEIAFSKMFTFIIISLFAIIIMVLIAVAIS